MGRGVINGLGHFRGYRNFETAGASRNLSPIGILIGGEELHKNHDAYAQSARLSYRWWEFDIGWFYIKALALLGLARVRRIAPKVQLKAVWNHTASDGVKRVERLKTWCKEAEPSGIEALQDFAGVLRGYTLQTA
jgi:hypothetical protein